MDGMRIRMPVLKIPKLEILDFPSIESDKNTSHTEQVANQHCYDSIEQPVDTTESMAMDNNFNAVDNRILFEHYFCITSQERNSVTAVCNFCKDAKAIRGCLSNNIRFVKHLEVSKCVFFVSFCEFL